MNRIIFLVTLLLCHIASIAQNSNEHLKFKGVPIDGTLREYVSKMESAGFSYIDTHDDGTAILQGDFAGFKGCLISVSTMTNSDIVNTISVIFPKKDDWYSLEENYLHLKKMLTEKYGDPAECVEEFQDYATDNLQKLQCLKLDKCIYVTIFATPKGDIKLSLGHQRLKSCFVKLQYWDRINTDTINAKAMDDL